MAQLYQTLPEADDFGWDIVKVLEEWMFDGYPTPSHTVYRNGVPVTVQEYTIEDRHHYPSIQFFPNKVGFFESFSCPISVDPKTKKLVPSVSVNYFVNGLRLFFLNYSSFSKPSFTVEATYEVNLLKISICKESYEKFKGNTILFELINREWLDISYDIYSMLKRMEEIYTPPTSISLDSFQNYFNSHRSLFDKSSFFVNLSTLQSLYNEMVEMYHNFELLSHQFHNIYQKEIFGYWNEAESIIKQYEMIYDLAQQFSGKMKELSSSQIMSSEYGKVNQFFLDSLSALTQAKVDSTIDIISQVMKYDVQNLSDLILFASQQYAWFYAMQKPFSVTNFQKTKNNFITIKTKASFDFELAELYAMFKMGGESTISSRLQDLLKSLIDAKDFELLASMLMWLKAYDSEKKVLQSMIERSIPMSEAAQNRLHALSTGAKEPIVEHKVQSSDSLHYDVSSLTWKENDYVAFFDNLAYQGNTLTYSLALRDDTKTITLPSGMKSIDLQTLTDKINSILSDEYDGEAKASFQECIAFSGNSQQTSSNIVIQSQECPQLVLLIQAIHLAKKLNLKFYTLYAPAGTNCIGQKQTALSMFNNLNPTVNMWEDSLKETILLAVQQMLNETSQQSHLNTSNMNTDQFF